MKKIFCVILSFLMAISTNIYAYAAYDFDKSSVQNDYQYKITSDCAEWKTLNSHDEMVAACQIADDEIQEMTTDMLVSAYLNYPLLGDMYAYNTIETGFAALRKQCNALDELLTREDVGEVLLKRYENIKLCDLDSSNRVSYNEFIAPSALEILAAQPEIINNTDDETFAAINAAIYKKCSAKSDEVYSATKSLYYSVLNEINETNSEYYSYDRISEALAVNHVSYAAISSSDFNWNYTVKTPKKSSVKVGKLKSGKELTSSEIRQCKNYVSSNFPGATYIATPTKKYNCHSYAWYSQSTSNGYWMNDPSKYMRDGSYKKDGYKVGNIIYYAGEHSGVVSLVKVGYAGCYVKSKWGMHGLYNHFYNQCPYSTSNLTYWAKA